MKDTLRATIAAMAVTGLLVTSAFVEAPFKKNIYLLDDVSPAPMTQMLDKIEDVGPLTRANLIITSDGGLVDLFLTAKAAIKAGSVDTEVVVGAYSAAGQLFLLGKNRVVHEGAIVHFHEPRLMRSAPFGPPIVITYTDARSILETGKVAENSKSKENGTDELIAELFKALPKKKQQELVDEMRKNFETIVKFTASRVGADVANQLFGPNKEVKLTADQALLLGVATKVIDNDGNERTEPKPGTSFPSGDDK